MTVPLKLELYTGYTNECDVGWTTEPFKSGSLQCVYRVITLMLVLKMFIPYVLRKINISFKNIELLYWM